jgi:predicted nucleic acid-binding protein
MKIYWDTSAVINAAINPGVARLLQTGEHFTRAHTFAEFFARMTGRGVRWTDQSGEINELVLDADTAVEWLTEFAGKIKLVELTGADTLAWIGQARRKGVQGGRVHDLLHAAAAEKAGAEKILTRNIVDFAGLSSVPASMP